MERLECKNVEESSAEQGKAGQGTPEQSTPRVYIYVVHYLTQGKWYDNHLISQSVTVLESAPGIPPKKSYVHVPRMYEYASRSCDWTGTMCRE